MEFSVKIDGVFQDFRAANAEDAAELARLMAGHTQTSGNKKPSITAAARISTSDAINDDVFGVSDEEEATVKGVLGSLRGTKTSRFINFLAKQEGYGGTDVVIKSGMAPGESLNLAPYVTSISKACTRLGVEVTDVLIRKDKRLRAGKILYFYKLTDAAAEYVNSIPDYENDQVFGVAPSLPQTKIEIETSETNDDGESNRDKVRRAAKHKTVQEISELTGLTRLQVRGVINAPTEKARFRKTPSPSGAKYTFAEH